MKLSEFCKAAAKAKKTSNADRIRAMTDEELANHFAGQCPSIMGGYRMHGDACRRFEDCTSCWLDWLKQEGE